jgi:hypothetical protein
MKNLLILTFFLSQLAFAGDCKVTTVTVEKNGQVEAETRTVCKEGTVPDTKIKIGDVVLESEVGESQITNYFVYHRQRCRMFEEQAIFQKKIRDYHGVICQMSKNDSNWIVVDKW